MKLLVKNLTYIVIIIISSGICFSQISSFDTSVVLISSADFDYKNPQFDKSQGSINYFIRDCIMAYERWGNTSNSNIVARFMRFDSLESETDITNDAYLNIHPSIAYFSNLPLHNEGAIVYQSNKNGSWGIFFTKYNGMSWSQPVLISSDSSDKTDPEIVGYSTNNYNNYLVTYVKNNDIYVRNYFNGIWDNEINVTADDSLICFSPKISRDESQRIYLAYLRKVNDSTNSIAYRVNQVNATGNLSIGPRKIIYQEKSQDNIRYSREFLEPVLVYDYDTLNKKHVYLTSNYVNVQNEFFNLTHPYAGNNTGGTFSTHGDITDFIYFTAACWINEKSDSLNIYAINRNSFSGDPKIFYAGNSSEKTFVNLSTKLCKGTNNLYRYRMLWEKKINDRTALMESHMQDYLSDVTLNSSNIPEKISLEQNYPNPFNPVTLIRYSIPSDVKGETSDVKLVVYDNLGKEIVTLVDEKQKAGNYVVEFDGSNLSSGIYFYSLEAAKFVETRRMILLK